MYDHGKETLQVNCEFCNLEHTITLNQIANEESIECNCGQLMSFKDENGSFKRAIADMNALHNPNKN